MKIFFKGSNLQNRGYTLELDWEEVCMLFSLKINDKYIDLMDDLLW